MGIQGGRRKWHLNKAQQQHRARTPNTFDTLPAAAMQPLCSHTWCAMLCYVNLTHSRPSTHSRAQVEALTNTLAQMQATNTAFATSLRFADSEATQEQQQALR